MPALSRDRILQTAVQLADRDGFEGATLRKIATELGVHVTSLYHHVATRDAVTEGIVEVLLAESAVPRELVGWEAWVRQFFAALSDVAGRHPGAFAALSVRPVQGEAASATFEVALAAFAKAGLDARDSYGAVKATVLLSLGAATERALQAAGVSAETALEQLSADAFPRVRSLDQGQEPEASWAFSLETLVSGLRAQVRSRRTR